MKSNKQGKTDKQYMDSVMFFLFAALGLFLMMFLLSLETEIGWAW